MASCNVRSCSTVFLLGGDVTLKVSNGFPLLKCLRQSMRIAMNKKMAGSIYLIHPLHVILDHFVKLLSLYNLLLKLLSSRNQDAKIINLHQIDSSLRCNESAEQSKIYQYGNPKFQSRTSYLKIV